MFEVMFQFIIDAIIALVLAVSMGMFHEHLHKRKAIALGCKVESMSLVKNETIVDTDDPVLIKQIARAPYVVIVPINIVILIIGLYFMQLGLIIGAGATLLLHAVSYNIEGKPERKVN